MTIEDLKKIMNSLRECKPGVEDFSWGPSLEFAERRKTEALKIIRKEIKRLKGEQNE